MWRLRTKKTMKKILLIIVFAVITANIYSQTTPAVTTVLENFRTQDGLLAMQAQGETKVDASNNVYTIGSTWNGLDYDLMLTKRDHKGNLIWFTTYGNYGGSGNDLGTSIALGDSGSVFTCGIVTDTIAKLLIQKFNASGTLVWSRFYGNTSMGIYGGAANLALDDSNNVYVVGAFANMVTGSNAIALKYSKTGTLKWQHSYDYNGLDDANLRVKVDSKYCYVSGVAQQATNDYKYMTINYYKGNGVQVGVTVSAVSSSTSANIVTDFKVNSLHETFITGAIKNSTTGYDFYIQKFDSTLTSVWTASYTSSTSNTDDISNSIAVNPTTGDIVVVGSTTVAGQGKNITCIDYNSAGTQQWIRNWNDSINGNDEGTCIKFTANGDIILTGYEETILNKSDFVTKRLNSTGNLIWSILYDGSNHLSDKPFTLAEDLDGNIVVVGLSEIDAGGKMNYATVQYAQKEIITPRDYHNELPFQAYNYFENRGQLLNSDIAPSAIPEVRYYSRVTYPNLYFNDNSFSMVFSKVDTVIATPDTVQRIQVSFKDSQDGAKVYPLEEQPLYMNFYYDICPDGITEVHGNQRLIVPDLYDNIDLMYTSNNSGLKYYFIVKPGGDPSQIKLKIDGASSVSINGTTNKLTINSAIGSTSFLSPKEYQLDASNNIITMTDTTADWTYSGGDYTFHYNSYDVTKALIIEVEKSGASAMSTTPFRNLSWSTYYTGNDWDEFKDMVTDNTGDVYAMAETSGGLYPTTIGILTNPLQCSMLAVTKFQKTGVQLYSTLYGVISTTQVPIIYPKGDVDGNGNFFLTGSIYRTAGVTTDIPFPTTPPLGAYVDHTYGGNSEVFVTKLAPLGWPLIWTSYFGTANYESGSDINIDANDYIYLTYSGGCDSLKHKVGAYWDSTIQGSTIIKFKPSLVREWATLFPRGGIVRGAFNKDQNFFVTGIINGTTANFPFQNPGTSFQDTTIAGADDIFMAEFHNSTCALLYTTIYGGTDYDQVNSIAVDKNDAVIITGTTWSSNFPCKYAGSGTYIDSTLGGTKDAFVVKWDQYLNLELASYIGGSAIEIGYDLATDPITGDVMLTGTTGSSDMVFATSSPYYTQSYGGQYDIYMLTLKPTDEEVWGSYIGYNKNESGICIATNSWNQVFMGGYTQSYQNAYFLNEDPGGGAWFDNTMPPVFQYAAHISRFSIDPSNNIGIQEHTMYNQGLLVYPNPANGEFNYILNTDDKTITLKVYNILGELVHLDKLTSNTGTFKGMVDLTNYQDGIYFVIAETQSKRLAQKIIKQ